MRNRTVAALVASVLLVFAGACASAGGPRSGGGSTDRLTRDEVVSVEGARNLYDVVQRLRPRWLQTRAGDRSFGLTTSIVVYQDQSYLGDVDALRQLAPDLAYELRWIDGTTASATLAGLGSQHVAGAIIVSTHPR
ncbi:MAG: hypothetical protein IRZ00_03635 [Gemmatimonadetes bacterium]|nr:hypothetical protein [Gemmatimonadota bacterium]